MDGENEFLPTHGYISSSGSESEPDDSKLELDEQFEAFKPPPLNINPAKHKIIIVDGPIPRKMSKRQKNKRANLLALRGPMQNSITDKMEEENKECLKIHEHISSLGTKSKPDDLKLEIDDQFEAFNPRPPNINPANHKIIVDDTTPKKMSKGQKKRLQKKRAKLFALNSVTTLMSNESTCDNQPNNCDNRPDYCDKIVYEKNFPLLTEGIKTDKIKENTEQQRPKRQNESEEQQKARAICMEYFNNHFYYAYENSDFVNFSLFKENYLNGAISDLYYNEKKKETKTERHIIENKNPLLRYLDNVGDLFNVMHFSSHSDNFMTTMYKTEDVAKYHSDVANIVILHNLYDLSTTFQRTLHYVKNSIQLAIQRNYVFTKQQIYYIEVECASILRIALLYNDFYNEYISVLKNVFLINGEFVTNPNNIGIIQYLSDVVCMLMKNTLNDMTEPKSTRPLFTSIGTEDEEFLLLCDNLHMVVTTYIEKTLQTVMEIAETMRKTFNPKHGVVFVYSAQKEKIRTHKTCNVDTSVKYTEKFVNPYLFIEDFWAKNKHTRNKCSTNKNKTENASVSTNTRKVPPTQLQTVSPETNTSEFDVKSMGNIDTENSFYLKSAGEDSSQAQLYQPIIIEDLTENRKYFYDGSHEGYDAESWRSFQSRYLNEPISNVYSDAEELESDSEGSESDSTSEFNVVIKECFIPSHVEDSRLLKTGSCNGIEHETSFSFRDILKILILYLLLKQPWFLNLIVTIIVTGADIIILTTLLVYLCVHFVINY